jgi:membrane-associated phospholipid phosphatase
VFSSLIQLDHAATAGVVALFGTPLVQQLLLPFTAIGYAALVWDALVVGGWILAPRLASARRESRPSAGPRSSAAGSELDAGERARFEANRVRAALWRVVLALLLTLLAVDYACKPLAGRDRPFVHGPKAAAIVWLPTTASFPSGHAASSAAGAFALSRVWPAAALPLWLLALLVMLSRVVLGVHYVSDVIAGALVGLLVAWLATTPAADRSPLDRQAGGAEVRQENNRRPGL